MRHAIDVISQRLLDIGLASGRYQYEDGELQKRCSACREYWPADSEFFHGCSANPDGLHNYCRACYCDQRWPQGRSTILPLQQADGRVRHAMRALEKALVHNNLRRLVA